MKQKLKKAINNACMLAKQRLVASLPPRYVRAFPARVPVFGTLACQVSRSSTVLELALLHSPGQ